ncbi:MAG: thermonuclease family protein [Deltaproteobacteria bacterium]|nr:thermonuclease family protein [Deltaproteobacteria bacterium]MBW1924134.1 thermonuclease family protein [Deltaproteobacteria bacterium]MBW1950075.1 thermonuclease family protein [Deltaproteobacteria bacterium]MBW2102255.1 thermonuclease family protein [Deltaproteobacteria bacterium]MBW2348258.1 thermonuclease family protein [Deltaproteobacteria bacterium]
MKRVLFLFVLLTLGLSIPMSAASPGGEFIVSKVYDGDTVRVEKNGLVLYVMLVGIDAPEISNDPLYRGQPFGEEAKSFLSRLVQGKKVEVRGFGKASAPFNKILGVLYLSGKNINLELVQKGLAEVYREGLPKGFDPRPYVEAETTAKKMRLGIWSLRDRYVSPHAWREGLRARTTVSP